MSGFSVPTFRRPRLAAALSLLTVSVFAGLSGAQSANAGESPPGGLVVRTPDGTVQGTKLEGSQAFLGLPFAKPPVYEQMWKAPTAPEKWWGTRDATEQKPACLQFEPTGVKNDQPTSLDCLYLDAYRPSDLKAGEQVPVMIFYHGGAATQGSGVLYGGQTMAQRDHVIVVSANYRLGASGNLALPALDSEDASTGGNFALLDQIAALKWVNRSIGAFGGDPGNVTIFGQSAGSRAVCNLLVTPGTEGLFQRAITESSACTITTGATKETAEKASEKYAAALGCPAGDNQLRCLRYAWPAEMVQQFGETRPSAYVGADVLPQLPGEAIAAGNWHKVPVIMGNTRWEQKLQTQQYADISAEEYRDMVIEQFGPEDGAKVLKEYPASDYEKPFYALAAMRTDNGAGCQMEGNAKLFAEQGVPVYRYEFDDPTSPTLFGFQPPGIDMSSAHSGELAYLFDFTLGDRPLTAKQEKLAHSMQDYWTAFARTGAPKARGEVMWPQYTPKNDKALKLAPKVHVVTGLADEHNCDFFGPGGVAVRSRTDR